MASIQIADKPLTFTEYLSLPDDGNRYELIDGVLYAMAPPTEKHQAMVSYLHTQFANFLAGKPCQVRESPIEVRLFPDNTGTDRHCIQPDVVVVCDKSQVLNNERKRIEGAPRIVIEVWSPSNERIGDLYDKKYWCEAAGVAEYWIVYDEHRVHQYILNEGYYQEVIYISRTGGDIDIPVKTFNSKLSIKLGSFIFDWPDGAIEDYL